MHMHMHMHTRTRTRTCTRLVKGSYLSHSRLGTRMPSPRTRRPFSICLACGIAPPCQTVIEPLTASAMMNRHDQYTLQTRMRRSRIKRDTPPCPQQQRLHPPMLQSLATAEEGFQEALLQSVQLRRAAVLASPASHTHTHTRTDTHTHTHTHIQTRILRP